MTFGNTRTPRRLAIALHIAAVLAAGSAVAQNAPAENTGTPPPKTATLQTINVTAEKRVEDMQKVPISMTVLPAEKLEAFGQAGDGVLQLASRAPSVYAETSYGREFPRFYIRGLGNSDFDLNASQPVSMVFDDIVQENPILKGFPLFDLEQVEVLRGPQGTLFGRNSPAGVIKFESRKPTQETTGYARVSYGSLGTANAEAALGGALSPNWSARVSALAQHRDGWIDNAYTGEKNALGGYNDRAIRLQALYKASETFDALINVHARWLDGSAMVNRANAIELGGPSFVPGFDRETVAQDGNNRQHLFTWGSNLHMNWHFGDLTFTSITGLERATTYSLGDVDGGYDASETPATPGLGNRYTTPFYSETADALPKDRQITQEFRLANDPSNQLKWQVGTYYFDEDIAIRNFSYDTLNNHVLNGDVSQAQRTKAWAIFGSADYSFTDTFDVRAGARYSHDKRNFTATRTLGFTGPVGPLTSDPVDARWSGDLTGTWAVAANTNVYARIANGFRAPSVQGRINFSNSISTAKPETITSYELGVKTTSDDNKVRFNADVYKYNMHNQQLTAVGGATNVTQLINAKKTEGYGAEFDLEAYLSPNLIVTAGGSYNHTELKDPNLAVAPCGGGCTVLDPLNSTGNAIIDGNPLPNAPKWIGTFTARYGIPYGDSGEFFVYTDWNYRSEVNFFLYDSAEFRSKAFLEGGLRVGYNWNFGKREVALYGRNITGKQVITGGIDFNNRTAFVNDPRVVGIEFRAEL
ncbi:iron complex outermembrane receptor protein [Luteibacter rhizovicinus]|uniref:Iron complex outermembrane receptor protein n=1 Tax=Luteibacter rhizovicinus TaxID=242606 RepID=A0A4R3YF74_9GAMM|nr:TonB-dependent receptor [Luteibacter rhizovicinus]TCV91185.1 iron complex outermembrane receptor protein [Luteibacter rhizovicinus]